MDQENNSFLPIISDTEKVKYDHLFRVADVDADGKVSGQEALNFLRHSKLPREQLAKIWDLADIDRDGSLSQSEFRITLHLIYWCLGGNSLPITISNNVIQSANLPVGQKPKQQGTAFPESQLFIPLPHLGTSFYGDGMQRSQSLENVSLRSVMSSDTKYVRDESSDLQIASHYLKLAFVHLESSKLFEAMKSVEESYSFVEKYPHRKKEIEVCLAYKLAIFLLIEIQQCDATQESTYGAIFSRFLGELILQPRHRLICTRMAINRNMSVRNYGVAARFIRVLLPLNLIDCKTLESKLDICQSNSFKDNTLPNYTCMTCKNSFKCSSLNCPKCITPVDVYFFIKEWQQIKKEKQDWAKRADENIKKSIEISKTPPRLRPSTSLSPSSDSMRSRAQSLTIREAQVVSPLSQMMYASHSGALTHREELVKEILETERTYVHSLDLLVNIYCKPMSLLKENIVPKRRIRDIFSVIEVIHNYNSIFLSKLEERVNTQGLTESIRLSDIFIDLGDFIKMYSTFVGNYNLAVLTVADLKQKSPQFLNFLDEARKRANSLDLQSLLIQPIQRVPRYVLLLQELLKHTPEEHPDHFELSRAHDKMKEVTDYINEKKKVADSMAAVLNIQEHIYFPNQAHLIQPFRRFVKKGNINEISNGKKKPRVCFLFNDILVVTKLQSRGTKTRNAAEVDINITDDMFTFKKQIDLSICVLLDVEDNKEKTIPIENGFELLLNNSDRSILFLCDSPEEKTIWMKEIHNQLQEIAEKERSFELKYKQSQLPDSVDGDLTTSEWDTLLINSEKSEHYVGEVIVPADGPSKSFYRIVNGTVNCILTNGDTIVAQFIIQNGNFGHRALFKRESSPFAFVVTSENCQLQSIDSEVLSRLLRIEPQISLRFHKNTAIILCTMLRTLELKTAEPVYLSGSSQKKEEVSKSKFKKRFPVIDDVALKEIIADYRATFTYHGVIYVSHKYLCFHSRVFGFRKKKIISITSVKKVTKGNNKDVIINFVVSGKPNDAQFLFSNPNMRDEFHRIIEDLVKNCKPNSNKNENPNLELENQMRLDKMGKNLFDEQQDIPSKDEWTTILKNGRCLQFKKGDIIIREGERHHRIFQITHGTCIVEKTVDSFNKTKIRDTIEAGELFGEMSFLNGDPSLATVIADSDDAEVYAIDRHSLRVLFSINPILGMKFYKYLCIVVEKHIHIKERQLLSISNSQ